MGMQGTMAPNFHEAGRSEYLAQYVFTAFGTSVPVPRQEDSGIDLHCTLGRRMGQRFHIERYYQVQVKSNKQEIEYENESIRWLLSQQSPYLYAIVDKKALQVDVYQTMPMVQYHANPKITRIIICFDDVPNPFVTLEPDSDGILRLSLGPPILKMRIDELGDKNRLSEFGKVLREWIDYDQENIDTRETGLNLFQFPEKCHIPNDSPPPNNLSIGNFDHVASDSSQLKRFHKNLCLLLAQYANIAAAKLKRQESKTFERLGDHLAGLIDIGSNIPNNGLSDSRGTLTLAGVVNSANEYFGIRKSITLKDKHGKNIPVPKFKIIANIQPNR